MITIEEIDKLLYDMSQSESSNLAFYLLGYAKTNKKFRKEYIKAMDANFDNK